MKRCLLFAWMLLVMFLVPAMGESFGNTDGSAVVAENDAYRLFLEYEQGETLQFYVEEKATGRMWHSSPPDWATSRDKKMRLTIGSQLVVNTLNKQTQAISTSNSQASSVAEGTTEVALIPNGFRVVYDFSRAKDSFRIPVEYILEKDGLRVNLLMTEIEEYGDAYVQTISVLQHFFAQEEGAEGYLLVPDGSGALIAFDSYHTGMTKYRQTIYGRDLTLTQKKQSTVSMQAALPVFGIHTDAQDLLAIASEGAALATIYGAPSGSESVYSHAYFAFIYRNTDAMTIADQTYSATSVTMVAPEANAKQNATILYRFTDGGYVRMAQVYREYLIEQGMTKKASALGNIRLDVYGGIKKERSAMGIIVTDLLPMTTFDEARQMISVLHSQGVDQLSMRYLGWNAGGLMDTVQDHFSPEGKLGGRAGWESLKNYAGETGVCLLPDVDFLYYDIGGLSHLPITSAVRTVAGEVAEQLTYLLSTGFENESIAPRYLLKAQLAANAANAFMRAWKGEALSVSTMGNTLYSDFTMGAMSDREANMKILRGLLGKMREQTQFLSLSGGNGYALPYADEITQTPLGDSGYLISTCDVPFFSIVMHGYADLIAPPINLTGDGTIALLKLLEAGACPCYAVTWEDTSLLRDTRYEHLLSTEFSLHESRIVQLYRLYADTLMDCNTAEIIGHQVEGDLRKTTFDNGTIIYVNYGLDEAVMDGHTIAGRGFFTERGGD